VWALLITNTYFSISAAVGFISIFGVAIMDGLLLVSYFNDMRRRGLSVHDAILQGAEKRVRPIMMTAFTAIFGLLPAAVSTDIGSQTQRPLAIVVVGGMITTLFLTRYLMPVLYSFYGHREPPETAGVGHWRSCRRPGSAWRKFLAAWKPPLLMFQPTWAEVGVMTEPDWLSCKNPQALLRFLEKGRQRTLLSWLGFAHYSCSARKRQLFACACCRR